MMYNKPEIVTLMNSIRAIQSVSKNESQADSSSAQSVTCAAYEADE
jgi:hypothetical protein